MIFIGGHSVSEMQEMGWWIRRIEGKKYCDIDLTKVIFLVIIVSILYSSYYALHNYSNYLTLFRIISYQRTQCSRSARISAAAGSAHFELACCEVQSLRSLQIGLSLLDIDWPYF